MTGTSASLDVRFFVPGVPVPKGNHDAFPVARGPCQVCRGPVKRCGKRNCFGGTIVGTAVTDDKGKELKSWEALIRVYAQSARNKAGSRLVEKPGAVEVRLVFLLSRPAGHYTTRGALSADGQRHPLPVSKPDWDKLSRAAADAMTGVLVEDDSQIVATRVSKSWAATGKPGVLIRARQIFTDEDWVGFELGAADMGKAITPTKTQGALF